MTWLASRKLAHLEQRIAFEEMLLAVRQAQERIARLEQAIRAAVPDWSLCEVVTALMALRGIDLVAATTFLAEIGDLSRFATPRELMAYLGLVPSEASTGDSVKRGPITKAGNKRARRVLVEAAWSYRHPPRVGRDLQVRVAAAPRVAREMTGFIWDICRQVMPGGARPVTAEHAERAVDRSSNAGARPAHSPPSAINP